MAASLGEEDAKHIVALDCLESRNWRTKLLNEECLNTNKEIPHRKTFKIE
jgi:hypothetical protein